MKNKSKETLLIKAKSAAKKQTLFSIKSYTLPTHVEEQLGEILGIFLEELGHIALKDSLAYCLRELAVNGKKANTKRVYFQEHKLNINDKKDYKTGMKKFKVDTLNNIDYWLKKQEEAGLYVKTTFHIRGSELHIKVANNTLISEAEQIRIYDRIARSRVFNSLEEAMTSVLDESEGAGLGIVILTLILKKIGLGEESFTIDIENMETVARLIIPMEKTKEESLRTISRELIERIENIPQFPEVIMQIKRILNDPDAELSDIARTFKQDPPLIAELLKTVNSAQYMLPRKIDSITEAIKIVGLKGLKMMLLSYGAQSILKDKESKDTRLLWKHCHKTAVYAYIIARNICRRQDIIDDVYTGAMLHDMGKILSSSLQTKIIDDLRQFSIEKGIPNSFFEELLNGANHAIVGAQIAEHWSFPDILIDIIRNHHTPLKAAKKSVDATCIVYLANELTHVKNNDYTSIDYPILARLNLTNYETLQAIHHRLKNQYQKQH